MKLYFTLVSVCSLIISSSTFSAYADTSIDSLIRTLSMRAKIGQMILVYHSPYEFLAQHGIGGVLIMQKMITQPRTLSNQLDTVQKRLPIPLLVTIDQEGGTVNRLSALAAFSRTPTAQQLSGWKPDSIFNYTKETAQALKKLNINMNLAPVLDPQKNHRASLTYIAQKNRSFGSGAEVITPPAASFVKGFTEVDIGCVAKHFPGYDVETNSDHALAVSDADSESIERNIAAFSALMPQLTGIMMSSIEYRKVSRLPAVLSPQIVQWARKIAGEKIIMTDDLWGTALRTYAHPGQQIHPVQYPDSSFRKLVALAVAAGNDMLMITYPEKVKTMIDVIEQMASADPAIAAHIEAALRRILNAKANLGLLTPQPPSG
ncbi:MAG: hypothetical protein JW795_14530 [Chitinivibrionales bacterium]|nr:hypothetical protein [Chitinivibrionales bacterium]